MGMLTDGSQVFKVNNIGGKHYCSIMITLESMVQLLSISFISAQFKFTNNNSFHSHFIILIFREHTTVLSPLN